MASSRNTMARWSATPVVTMATLTGMLLAAGPAGASSLGQRYEAGINGWIDKGNDGRESFSMGTPDGTQASTAQSFSFTSENGAASVSASDERGGTVSAVASIAFEPHFPQVTEIYTWAHLYYTFKIDGSDPDAKIPVVLNAVGGTSGTEAARLGISLGSYEDSSFKGYTYDGYGRDSASAFDIDSMFYFSPGKTYYLNLLAEASVYNSDFASDGVLSSGATIDPTFTIQGDFAKDYHFVGLPASAIGSAAAAVPEPASWAMMAGGFGLVGSIPRRRRARSQCV